MKIEFGSFRVMAKCINNYTTLYNIHFSFSVVGCDWKFRFHFEIKLNKSNIKKYPYIWLRDCCTCKSCFDTQNHQHLVDLASVPDDVKPITVSHLKEKIEVICKL